MGKNLTICIKRFLTTTVVCCGKALDAFFSRFQLDIREKIKSFFEGSVGV